jgi:hypothetical protein
MAMKSNVAVAYLARGLDSNALINFQNFADSYKKFRPGLAHTFFIIFKGFHDKNLLKKAKTIFRSLNYSPFFCGDNEFDIGAYRDFARAHEFDYVLFFKSSNKILAENWLLKYYGLMIQPGVGSVASSGSFESLHLLNPLFPEFPNPHIRSCSFMIRRSVFLEIVGNAPFKTKMDCYLFESGPNSMTRQLLEMKLDVLIVGKNGRGYSKNNWHLSKTSRLYDESNLLICDIQNTLFKQASWEQRKILCNSAWGHKVNLKKMYSKT